MLGLSDALLLAAAVAVAALALQTGGAKGIAPSWVYHGAAESPAPVLADIDADGRTELLVCTPDGRLLVLMLSASAQRGRWGELRVLRETSLRAHLGLANGRRAVAIGAGPLRTAEGNTAVEQVVVVLTEDWTAHAFDHELRPLWVQPLAPSVSTRGFAFHEASVLVAPQPLYVSDSGVVVVGGCVHGITSTEQARAEGHGRQWGERLGSGEQADGCRLNKSEGEGESKKEGEGEGEDEGEGEGEGESKAAATATERGKVRDEQRERDGDAERGGKGREVKMEAERREGGLHARRGDEERQRQRS
eukprot:5905269-Pleurochrysis_carterae.AAC.3